MSKHPRSPSLTAMDKTASTSTIVSGNNVPFILARAEGEDARRSSLDGKQRLQEEFEKKHESTDSRADANVDWGAWPLSFAPIAC